MASPDDRSAPGTVEVAVLFSKAFVAGAFQREVLNIQKRKQNSPRSGQHVCTIELPRDSKFVPQVPQSQ
jgi:hypothetical protein